MGSESNVTVVSNSQPCHGMDAVGGQFLVAYDAARYVPPWAEMLVGAPGEKRAFLVVLDQQIYVDERGDAAQEEEQLLGHAGRQIDSALDFADQHFKVAVLAHPYLVSVIVCRPMNTKTRCCRVEKNQPTAAYLQPIRSKACGRLDHGTGISTQLPHARDFLRRGQHLIKSRAIGEEPRGSPSFSMVALPLKLGYSRHRDAPVWWLDSNAATVSNRSMHPTSNFHHSSSSND